MLDSPETKVEDPEIAAALHGKGRKITLTSATIAVVLTLGFYLLP